MVRQSVNILNEIAVATEALRSAERVIKREVIACAKNPKLKRVSVRYGGTRLEVRKLVKHEDITFFYDPNTELFFRDGGRNRHIEFGWLEVHKMEFFSLEWRILVAGLIRRSRTLSK